ncbi:Polysaccharide monooxygenase Cel61a [Colletotrichum tanaceti]|uniref:lytic cellulose monooxygenase (C4-dehydrogenating) n=1 Tax=Colletotrichum tanaceti TaxID=1306861 RepID=A0A4U6X4U7_9PEZI|nr:Polysaccharide monooxygenase Cel61a [Colletotrichum tanaceti]TKW50418.1 Polysaccharide monooxygenase Cel61a [Colletotrichum tanaceti]
MGHLSPSSLLLLAALAATGVSAHGHVNWLVADGVAYRGWDSPAFTYSPPAGPVVGWKVDVPDNGFVEPVNFGTNDIICHKNGVPAGGHATVPAGARIQLVWDTWPESHKGPVIDYLARCGGGDCETVDKTSLEFFKIGAAGLIDMSLPSGNWAADRLIANGFTWTLQIPPTLAPGNYVLRHEILALHSGGNPNGAQAYPQCFNIRVTGGGSLAPAGVKGTALYKADDPGVLFNLYTSPLVYQMPGPTLVAGLPSTVAQSTARPTATSSATPPGATGGNGGGSPSTTLRTTTVPAPATTTITSTRAATTSAGGGGATVPKYGQCGGQGWTGLTICAAGSTCQALNPFYSQCV